MEGPAADQKLELVLGTRKDLASLRWHLLHDEQEGPEQAEELDRFIAKVPGADEEAKSVSKEIWRLTRPDREEKVRSLKQDRGDLSEMVFDDFSERWMTRTKSTVDYWLEVALDLEGVLHGFSCPSLQTESLILGYLFEPRTWGIVRWVGSLFYLAVGVVLLYVAFGTRYPWVGWLLAACLAWLVFRLAKKADRADRDVRRWRQSLTVLDGCVKEVASRHFNPSEITRRLREQEKNGLFVQSTIFTILERSAALHETTDTEPRSASG